MSGAQQSGASSNSNDRTSFREENDAVLQAVLESTSRASEETIRPEILDALKNVARRHSGETECSPEVLSELIGVFVTDTLAGFRIRFSDAWVRNLTDDILAAMTAAPATARQIERLWSRLQQAVA